MFNAEVAEEKLQETKDEKEKEGDQQDIHKYDVIHNTLPNGKPMLIYIPGTKQP